MLSRFKQYVSAFRKAHDAGEDITVYRAGVDAMGEMYKYMEDDINVNVVHAVHEFAHMLAQDPQQFLKMKDADELVTYFFDKISAISDTDEVKQSLANETYTGIFVPETCEHNTAASFTRSIHISTHFKDVFEKFEELNFLETIRSVVNKVFSDTPEDSPTVDVKFLSGDEALDFLRDPAAFMEGRG